MNDEELRSTIEQVKAQVKAKPENKDKTDDEIDEIILDGFFKAYTEGELTKEDLGAIAQAMGYEFTDEFEADEEGAPMQVEPEEATPTGEGGLPATEQELEDARTINEGESAEEFKEEIDDINERKEGGEEEDDEFDEEETEEDEEEEEGEEDEESEREKASELWKMNLRK